MSRRRAAFLSWTMWVPGAAGMAIGAVLAAQNSPISTNEPPSSLFEDIIWVSSFVGFGLVGALLVSSRPSNRIGWILSGIASGWALGCSRAHTAATRWSQHRAPFRWVAPQHG